MAQVSKHVPKANNPGFYRMELFLAESTLAFLNACKLPEPERHIMTSLITRKERKTFLKSLVDQLKAQGITFSTGEPVDYKYVYGRVTRVWPVQQQRTLADVIRDSQAELARFGEKKEEVPGYKPSTQEDLFMSKETELKKDSQEIKRINFYGDEVTGIKAADGKIYTPVRQLCENLGIDSKSQRLKIQQHNVLRRCGVIITSHDSSSREQEMFCLEADAIPLWLATIHTNKIAPALREKFEKYLWDVKKVLADVFMGPGFAVNPNPARVDTEAMKSKAAELSLKKMDMALRTAEYLRAIPDYNPKAIAPLLEQGMKDMMGVGVTEKSLLDTSDFLKDYGLSPTNIRKAAPVFGKIAKEVYIEKTGKEPPKYQRFVDGAQRLVNSYTSEDRPILEEAFQRFAKVHPEFLN